MCVAPTVICSLNLCVETIEKRRLLFAQSRQSGLLLSHKFAGRNDLLRWERPTRKSVLCFTLFRKPWIFITLFRFSLSFLSHFSPISLFHSLRLFISCLFSYFVVDWLHIFHVSPWMHKILLTVPPPQQYLCRMFLRAHSKWVRMENMRKLYNKKQFFISVRLYICYPE